MAGYPFSTQNNFIKGHNSLEIITSWLHANMHTLSFVFFKQQQNSGELLWQFVSALYSVLARLLSLKGPEFLKKLLNFLLIYKTTYCSHIAFNISWNHVRLFKRSCADELLSNVFYKWLNFSVCRCWNSGLHDVS